MSPCLGCKKLLEFRWQKKYCSNRCQMQFQHIEFVRLWKKGNLSASELQTQNISKHIKRYLLSMQGEKCSVCSWNQKHPLSGNVPLEVDHIDGNFANNLEENLRLLCPNCHSLTMNFRNLNRGKGRNNRKGSMMRSYENKQ